MCYTDPSLSALHHALRASRRRLIVALIADRFLSYNQYFSCDSADGVEMIDASRLAREIVAIEEDIAVEAATGSRYHSVYTALIQTHLPKLHSIGVIEYQPDQKKVRPDQNFLALATTVAITSTVAQLFFDESLSEHSLGGPTS
jgi:hypothetical protein